MQRMRRTRRRSKRQRQKLKFLNALYRIDGLQIIFLTPMTQKFVGCDIGNKILPTIPWIFVDKEKIEAHLEYYGNESCFYPIKNDIEAFETELILVGSYRVNPDISANFFVCTTLKAEEAVLKLLDEQRTYMELLLARMQTRTAGLNWYSFGSEQEILDEMPLNNRNLYVLEVRSINLTKQKHTFKMSFVENITNGYVELVPGRNICNVMRKCLNRGVQSSPDYIDKKVQTDSLGTYTTAIQYCYEYPEIKLTKSLAKTINKFILKQYPSMDEYLDDINLELCKADFQNLSYSEDIRLHKPIDIKTYSDVIYCRSKRISCLSWNSLISGRVAVAYAKYPLFLKINEEQTETNTASFENDSNLLLIWDYEDTEKPKLYLRCREEVSSMSFCPYNENILVTGYTNGQISIWDLTDCIDTKKFYKFRTLRQHSNYASLLELSNWFLDTTSSNHVFPTLTSTPNVSHSSPVTSILWFPPKSLEVDKKYYLKFMTSGLDDNAFFIWIIDPTQILFSELEKINRRKFSRPESLNQGISILKGLKKYFVPSKKLFLGDIQYLHNNPVFTIMQNDFYTYEIENPDTIEDLNTQTIFKMTGTQHFLDADKKVLFACGLGESFVASCEDTEMSNDRTVQICCLTRMQPVHDGPILVCETNAFFQNVVLTVGGTVFAIWDCSKTHVALIWRKCSHRYLSGMWCFHRPLSILLLRNDRYFDYWNVCDCSLTPIQSFKYTGHEPIMFYGDSNKFYVRKNTFIVTDKIGSFKTLLLPTETIDQDLFEIDEAEDFIRSNVDLKKRNECLQMKFKKMKDQSLTTQESIITEQQIVMQIDKEVPLSKEAFFIKKLEEHGISVLLAIRQIPVDGGKAKFLECNESIRAIDKQFQYQQLIKRKLVKHTKHRFTFEGDLLNSKRCEFKVIRDPDLAKALKTKYFQDYEKLENDYKLYMQPKHRKLSDFENETTMLFIDKYKKIHSRGVRYNHHDDQNKMMESDPVKETILTFQSTTELI